ncbi:hypothetical protein SLEP1_g52715 [Rubroshorea leprosula]|uniref:Uncharacterized protein n=1 Tax=Rubroshorea leprosula TaxID=152421 RepID=A0AAV5M9E6_9ROSI|nr:hypothetical protein SLEP1_g52715 [Rubroshorea leprosula]
MITEKKPHRRLCRRQNHLQLPIGVSLRQQHLQRAMNTTLRHVEVRVTAIKMEMKRVKNSNKKERVVLREMEAMLPQLIAKRMQAEEERMHALEECVRTQACCDAMEVVLFAP